MGMYMPSALTGWLKKTVYTLDTLQKTHEIDSQVCNALSGNHPKKYHATPVAAVMCTEQHFQSHQFTVWGSTQHICTCISLLLHAKSVPVFLNLVFIMTYPWWYLLHATHYTSFSPIYPPGSEEAGHVFKNRSDCTQFQDLHEKTQNIAQVQWYHMFVTTSISIHIMLQFFWIYDINLVAIKYNVSNNCEYVNVYWLLNVDTV